MRLHAHGRRTVPTIRNVERSLNANLFAAASWRPRAFCSVPLRRGFLILRAKYAGYSTAASTLNSSHALDEPITQDPPSISYPRQKNNLVEWLALLEPYLPPDLRDESVPATSMAALESSDFASAISVSKILYQAGKQGNIDLLAHLGLVDGRWKAVMHHVQTLLNVPAPTNEFGRYKPNSLMKSPNFSNLSELTYNRWRIKQLVETELEETSQSKRETPNLRLEVSDTYKSRHFYERSDTRLCNGIIWQLLGNLILAAAKTENTDSKIMSHVLQIIEMLHRKSMIPSSVYSYAPNDDPSAVQQPPLLPQYSTLMLSSLYDAVNHIKQSNNSMKEPAADAKTSGSSSGPQLMPELWLEFVLWCCVHSGHVVEGSNILKSMKKLQGSNRWSLITWRDLVDATGESWNDVIRKKLGHVLSGLGEGLGLLKPAVTRRSLKQTVSAEVVAALVDGLVVHASSSAVPTLTKFEFIDQLNVLKGLLERDRLGLGVLTWNSILARLAEAPNFSVEGNERTFETALVNFQQNYGNEIGYHNDPVSNYIFDPSATVLGLYHRLLTSYLRSHDGRGAIRVLSCLVSLTDKNKYNSVQEFFATLRGKSRSAARSSVDRFDTSFPGVQYPNFYPNIPLQTMATLLDLTLESDATEVGRWMLYAEYLEGPMIPENLYQDQRLAPSLIRFAAMTEDEKLLSKVMKEQTVHVSGRTLLALCESRMLSANWSGAMDVLRLIRKYSIYELNIDDFSRLARALVSHIKPVVGKQDRQTSDMASDLLVQLLRGDIGRSERVTSTQLATVAAILASTSPELRRSTSGLLTSGTDHHTDIPSESFGMILEGLVKAHGSRVGRKLWSLWCSNQEYSRVIKTFGATERPTDLVPKSENFGRAPADDTSDSVVFYGNVDEKLAVIRVIVQQALQEHHSTAAREVDELGDGQEQVTKSPTHPQLEWASDIMQLQFDMTEQEVDEEMDNYLSITRGKVYGNARTGIEDEDEDYLQAA